MTGLPSGVASCRALAAATGVAYGIGIGSLLSRGEMLVVAWAALVGAALAGLVALFPEARRRAWAIFLLAYGARLAAATLMYFGSLDMGRGGFITGDDASYSAVAWQVIQIWRGEPTAPIGPNAYLLGAFVYVEMLVYAVFGQQPLFMLVLNGALGTAVGVFAFEMARQLFSTRSAILATVGASFFPSLVLWSSLNLKDALALLLVVVFLWALLQFHLRREWPFLALAVVPLVPMQSLRKYIFLELAVIVVLAVAVAFGMTLWRRIAATLATAAISAALVIAAPAGTVRVGPDIVTTLEQVRFNMAVRARTGFTDALPAKEGDTFVVLDPRGTPTSTQTQTITPARTGTPVPSAPTAGGVGSPTPTPSVQTSPTPRVVNVAPGAKIVVVPAGSTPPATTQPGVAVVRPGDIVVVGAGTPAPLPQQRPIHVEPLSAPVKVVATDQQPAAMRLITYLPKGLAYVLFAPFPWEIERALDWLTLPEMFLWYLIATAAVGTAWTYRRRWRLLAPLVVFVGGTIVVLALAEGNVGTLFRHRGMVIPFVAILAAPALSSMSARVRRQAIADPVASTE